MLRALTACSPAGARREASTNGGSALGARLVELRRELVAERETLEQVMRRLRLRRSRAKVALGRMGQCHQGGTGVDATRGVAWIERIAKMHERREQEGDIEATCRRFAEEGAHVVSIAVDDADGNIRCDVADAQQVDRAFAQVDEALGGVDVLVANAGVSLRRPFLEIGEEGPTGLITYMRTDSTRVSNDALAEVRTYINDKYGPAYLPPQSFDVVLMTDVLEHIQADAASARAALSLVRPGGIVIATVPAYQWLYSPR